MTQVRMRKQFTDGLVHNATKKVLSTVERAAAPGQSTLLVKMLGDRGREIFTERRFGYW